VIQSYDQAIIGVYFIFLLAVGLVFRRLSKNTSDYFRCGGAMPWWITGASAWIAGFSAWTFVGVAAKVYETGMLILWSYYPTVVALAIVMAYFCIRFRRMRVVTWMEGVRGRYGAAKRVRTVLSGQSDRRWSCRRLGRDGCMDGPRASLRHPRELRQTPV
jgi:solute:Na+ symporter, SSS family